jgi:hypothetical protein
VSDTPMEWPEDDDDLEPLEDAETRHRAATAGLTEYSDYPCPEDPDGLHFPGCGCSFL